MTLYKNLFADAARMPTTESVVSMASHVLFLLMNQTQDLHAGLRLYCIALGLTHEGHRFFRVFLRAL